MSPTPNSTANAGATPALRGQCQTIDLAAKLALVDGFWQQRVVSEMNDYQFKVARLAGEFVWHAHGDTDETFIVLEGELRIAFRDGPAGDGEMVLRAGQMGVVPRGVEHKPHAIGEVKLLLVEPRGVTNTGDGERSERTVANDLWI